MQDITFTPLAVNVGLLDQQLKTGLNNKCFGISWDGKTLTVHLDDTAQQPDFDQVASIVKAHDPTQLTPDQQKVQTAVADDTKLRSQLENDLVALQAINATDVVSACAAINQMAAILAVQLSAFRTKL